MISKLIRPALCLVFVSAPGLAAAQTATYITDVQVDDAVRKAPAERVSDQQIRMVDAGAHNIGLGVVTRPATQEASAILHHKQTEVYHVLSGSGTMVTGGKLTNTRELDAEGMVVKKLTGPSAVGIIEDGTSHELRAGEYVIVPAGVAHGFTEIREKITYVVIRVDPEKLVELK